MAGTGKSAQNTTASSLSAHRRRLRDGLFIAVGAVCLFLLLALTTYHDADPGWSASGSGAAIRNLGGVTGAFFADIFFSLIGFAAYLVPCLLGYQAEQPPAR